MRRSSQINQANLFAVLMGEKRRKPLVRRALVSQLYPVFFEDSLSALSIFSGGKFFTPPDLRDDINGLSFLSAGDMESFVKSYDSPLDTFTGSNLFSDGSMEVQGGPVSINTFEYAQGSSSLSTGSLRVVVISYTNPVEKIEGTTLLSSGVMS